MARMEYSAGRFLFLLLLVLPAYGFVLTTTEETLDPETNFNISSDDEPDPSYFLSMVHDPSSEEITIHQLSKNILAVTKDLINFTPRSAGQMTVEERLTALQNLDSEQVLKILDQQGVKLPPVKTVRCDFNTPFYRTFDGSCNNLKNPCWGKASEPYQRWLPPVYADGVGEIRRRMDGSPLPSPRQVFQWVSSELQATDDTTYDSESNLGVFWGQMIAHELLLTPTVVVKEWDNEGQKFVDKPPKCCEQRSYHECIPIVMDYADPFYPMGHCMDIVRSAAFAYSPSSCRPFQLGMPREQMNQLTSFIDASIVYGSSEKEARELREDGGLGAKLLMDYSTGYGYPPRKNRDCKASQSVCDKRCFHAGERRSNENPFLAVLHTVWAREHNRLVEGLRGKGWPEETLFHVVRKILGAIMQHITYKEYLPVLLGPDFVDFLRLSVPTANYHYDPELNPAIFNVFGAAAFRYGHSMLGGRYRRLGQVSNSGPVLAADFFSMDDFCSPHQDPLIALLLAQAQQKAQKVDNIFTRQVTNHLFAKAAGEPGLDLFSINLQRGRDHGLPPYTKWRAVCGLPPVNDYADLRNTIPQNIIEKLAQVYGPGGVHEIDLYPAGLSEFPVNGGNLGPTFTCIVSHQFKVLKFGDRFWYENIHHPGAFTTEQIAAIQKTTLASILCRNANLGEIQPNMFFLESATNPRMPCEDIKQQTDLDLNLWS